VTILRQIALECPVCRHGFTSQAVLTTNSFGGKRTDFHERAFGVQPLSYCVHTCSRCGYTGAERDFSEEVDVEPWLKDRVWDELAPKLPAGPMTGSDKYEFAAKVALWRDADAYEIGSLFLRAAWCCVEEDDTEAERYFRRKAACTFEQALAGYDDVKRDERAALTYLVGELWRRIGDEQKARTWFDEVPSEITDMATQRWIIEEARRQRDHPREWFA
jgi:uncharacterized protein (DUF2225 family)